MWDKNVAVSDKSVMYSVLTWFICSVVNELLEHSYPWHSSSWVMNLQYEHYEYNKHYDNDDNNNDNINNNTIDDDDNNNDNDDNDHYYYNSGTT